MVRSQVGEMVGQQGKMVSGINRKHRLVLWDTNITTLYGGFALHKLLGLPSSAVCRTWPLRTPLARAERMDYWTLAYLFGNNGGVAFAATYWG